MNNKEKISAFVEHARIKSEIRENVEKLEKQLEKTVENVDRGNEATCMISKEIKQLETILKEKKEYYNKIMAVKASDVSIKIGLESELFALRNIEDELNERILTLMK